MNKYQSIILLLLLTWGINNECYAQDTANSNILDSLIIELQKDNLNDTNYVYILSEIGTLTPIYRITYWDSIVDIAVEALQNKPTVVEKNTLTKLLTGSYNNLGYVYSMHGDIPNAKESFNKSIELREQSGDIKGTISALYNLSHIYANTGDTPKAISINNRILELSHNIGDNESYARSLDMLGNIYIQIGDLITAERYYKKSLELREEIGIIKGIAEALFSMNNLYVYLDDSDKALYYSKKSLQLYHEINDITNIARLSLYVGINYYKIREVSNAIKYLKQALEISKEIQNIEIYSNTLNSLGDVYMNQGNYDKALDYQNKSLKIEKAMKNKYGTANRLNNIGATYQHKGDLTKALESMLLAMEIQIEIGNKEQTAASLGNIGFVYSKKGNDVKALDYYYKSLNIRNEIGDKFGIANSKINIGYILQFNDSIDKAKSYANQSLLIGHQINSQQIIKSASILKKEIAILQTNSLSKADKQLSEYYSQVADTFAINVINISNKDILSNFTVLSETSQELFFNTVIGDYMEFNSYALMRQEKNPDIINQVFNNTIKNKGLLLKSSTAMRNSILNSGDTVLINQYEIWIRLRKQIAKTNKADSSFKELLEKADDYEKELVKSSQVFSDFEQLQNISWMDVQKSLKQGEVAIEFINFKYKNYTIYASREFTDTIYYCALILTAESKSPIMIPLFLEEDLEEILGQFKSNNYNYINSIYGGESETNTKLYNLIWKPIEESLKGIKTIYLSPSGLLHKISFPAINKEQDIYLCDIYDIEVKSSTGKIVNGSSNVEGISELPLHTATLFGGINYNTDSTTYQGWTYLDGTKTETQKINKILKKGKLEVNYYSNTFATEEEFKLMASNSNILHIATHGFFYPDPREIAKEVEEIQTTESSEVIFRGGNRGFGVNSFVENPNPLMRSGLVFAGANDVWSIQDKGDSIDDGVLTAQEVAYIDMRKTKLVVMSACETGLGDIKGSEGVYGLQRAFKIAGVDYMIMSLWQVPDKETEEFMTKFYKKLMKQNNLPDGEAGIKKAFNETQNEMRAKYAPYFWGAFVLIE